MYNSAIIDTRVVTSSSSPNISSSIFIDTLHRTSHLQRFSFVRGAILLPSNSLSYENWLLLLLEPYLLRFPCNFKAKRFFLETCPFNKYFKRYIFLGGDFVGGELTGYHAYSQLRLDFP